MSCSSCLKLTHPELSSGIGRSVEIMARLHLPLACGGLDLDVPARLAFDPARVPGDALVIAVGPSRTLAVAHGRLADVHAVPSFARHLAERYAAGGLFYVGRIGTRVVLALTCAADEARALEEGRLQADAVTFRSIRELADLPAGEAMAASHALALAQWWRTSRFCTRCGGPVTPAAAGWEQHCGACGAVEYPRQDPSVIVAVTNEDDELLLAHNIAWKSRSVSILAGFVEAGESPEQAVAREVAEEVGIAVDEVSYAGSQAWPFPRSLMLGFTARTRGRDLVLDPSEIGWARFFSRDGFDRACEEGTINPPGPVTIASALVADWLGYPIIYRDGWRW